ncbi:MAG: STAS domain-containing protein [Mycobacterium sp.]
MTISIHHADAVTTICVEGELDMLTAPTLAEYVNVVFAGTSRAVVIDLNHVEFLSAAGLEVLASARRTAGPGTGIALVAAGRAVRRPIQLTGIDEILPVFLTRSAAITALTALQRHQSATT